VGKGTDCSVFGCVYLRTTVHQYSMCIYKRWTSIHVLHDSWFLNGQHSYAAHEYAFLIIFKNIFVLLLSSAAAQPSDLWDVIMGCYDACSLPQINIILSRLPKADSIDLKDPYWQVPLEVSPREDGLHSTSLPHFSNGHAIWSVQCYKHDVSVNEQGRACSF